LKPQQHISNANAEVRMKREAAMSQHFKQFDTSRLNSAGKILKSAIHAWNQAERQTREQLNRAVLEPPTITSIGS
jgi:flagellar hook-basal body complex protein FliE